MGKNKKTILISILVILTLGFSYIISSKFISRGGFYKISQTDIFEYSYIITFLFTTIGVLITLITFVYAIFDKFIENISGTLEKYSVEDRKNVEESIFQITKELSDNIKLTLALLIIVFIYFIGHHSKINQLAIFSDIFVLTFKMEVYLLSIIAIIDTILTLLNLLQYGLFSKK